MIRTLSPSDLSRIMEIERVSFPTPWSETFFRQEFNNPLGFSYGYDEADKLVGYIFAWLIFEDAHINSIAVDPSTRRRGIATHLLDAVFTEALARGGHFVSLEVRVNNAPARRFYTKHGFQQVAVRAGYYADTGEDALVLARDL